MTKSHKPIVYGIWNTVDKRFVFGIKEDTADKAAKHFKSECRKLSYMWRYEVKRIPDGWINPPNPTKY